MPHVGVDWERCGNTPYYSSGAGFNRFFVDPFNWRFISSALTSPGALDEGTVSVIHRKAPRYDWDALKRGVYTVSEDEVDRQRILRATHEWATDVMKARTAGVKLRDLRMLFEAAPVDVQRAVLQGVRAMFAGFDQVDLEQLQDPEIVSGDIILVVPAGSAAEDRIDEVEAFYQPGLTKTIIDSSVERGYDLALAQFNILEC